MRGLRSAVCGLGQVGLERDKNTASFEEDDVGWFWFDERASLPACMQTVDRVRVKP